MVPSSEESPQWPTWEFLFPVTSWAAHIDTVYCKAKQQIELLHRHFHAGISSKNLQLGLSLGEGLTLIMTPCYTILIGQSSALEERGRNCCCLTTFWEATRCFHHLCSPLIHFHTSDIITLFPCTNHLAVQLLTPLFQLVLYDCGTIYLWTLIVLLACTLSRRG